MQGIFTSLTKAENFAEKIQRNSNERIEAIVETGYKEEYYMNEDSSLLKVKCLTDLINKFIGKNHVWIKYDPLTPIHATVVDFDHDCVNDEIMCSVRVNESFKVDYIISMNH